MRLVWLILASLFLATSAWAHTGTLDAYGCHSNKQALGSAQKRECHVGLLAGNVYPSLTAELQAYIAKQQLIIDDYTVKLKQCEAKTCPVCPICETCQTCPTCPVCPVEPPPTTSSLSLSWAANTEPDLAGYKVYCGTVSHMYDAARPVGKVTSLTIGNLPVGHTYYCGVTAVDTSSNESQMSAEVSKVIP